MAQYSEPNIQGIVKPRFPGSFAGVTEIQDQHEPNIIGVDQSHFPGTKSPLKILELNFDGPDQSTSIIDTSPFARTAILSGSVKLSTTDPIQGRSSLSLDGLNDYITYSASSDFALGNNDFYWGLRFRTSSQKPNMKVIGMGNCFFLIQNGSINLATSIFDFNGGTISDYRITDGESHLLEFRRYNNLIETSIDRRIVNRAVASPFESTTRPFYFGGFGSDVTNFEGSIDNFIFLK